MKFLICVLLFISGTAFACNDDVAIDCEQDCGAQANPGKADCFFVCGYLHPETAIKRFSCSGNLWKDAYARENEAPKKLGPGEVKFSVTPYAIESNQPAPILSGRIFFHEVKYEKIVVTFSKAMLQYLAYDSSVPFHLLKTGDVAVFRSSVKDTRTDEHEDPTLGPYYELSCIVE